MRIPVKWARYLTPPLLLTNATLPAARRTRFVAAVLSAGDQSKKEGVMDKMGKALFGEAKVAPEPAAQSVVQSNSGGQVRMDQKNRQRHGTLTCPLTQPPSRLASLVAGGRSSNYLGSERWGGRGPGWRRRCGHYSACRTRWGSQGAVPAAAVPGTGPGAAATTDDAATDDATADDATAADAGDASATEDAADGEPGDANGGSDGATNDGGDDDESAATAAAADGPTAANDATANGATANGATANNAAAAAATTTTTTLKTKNAVK